MSVRSPDPTASAVETSPADLHRGCEDYMKRVLVADDHPGFLDMLVATLGGDDTYQMSLARDGQEALELAQQEMPDLVLLDVRMPRLDGLAVCRALKSSDETFGIMVLMLSGLSDALSFIFMVEVVPNQFNTFLCVAVGGQMPARSMW